MKRIFLVRHGAIEKPDERSYCIGRTDWPLSGEGRAQAALLQTWFDGMTDAWAATSPLARCADTAGIAMQRDVPRDARLTELNMGEWDGLAFETILARWPETYRLRGESICRHVPPGAENPLDAQKRALAMLETAAETSVFFSHAGLCRLLLCHLDGRSPDEMTHMRLDTGSVSLLVLDRAGWRVAAQNLRPAKTPPLAESEALLSRLPQHVAAHCRAVRSLALEMTDALSKRGLLLDRGLVGTAALLHDVCRLQENHASAGAALVAARGFSEAANVIALHHNWSGDALDEAALVFLADKYIQGTERTPLAERFRRSAARCETDAARSAHEARFRAALHAETLFCAQVEGE